MSLQYSNKKFLPKQESKKRICWKAVSFTDIHLFNSYLRSSHYIQEMWTLLNTKMTLAPILHWRNLKPEEEKVGQVLWTCGGVQIRKRSFPNWSLKEGSEGVIFEWLWKINEIAFGVRVRGLKWGEKTSGEGTRVSTERHLGGHESVQGMRHRLLSIVHEGEWQKIKLERQVRARPCHAKNAR